MLLKTPYVFVNGRWIGVHTNPVNLVGKLKLLRRNGVINIFTSISWNISQNEVHILTYLWKTL